MSERRTSSGTTYVESGSGQPLVLLHGFPLSRAMWQPQIDGLREVARVIALDLPGFGGSAPLPEPPTVDAMADRVVEFLDDLAIREPIVLCGLSMGGYVSLAVARRHASRLRGLILADTKADPDDAAGKAGRDKMIALAKESGPRAVIDQMLPKLLGADTAVRRPALADDLRAIALAQPTTGIMAALQAMRDRPDSTSGLAKVTVPTLVLVGEQDILIPPAKSRDMSRALPNSRVVVISGAGHMANLEQPDAFNTAVKDYLHGLA
jgi:3-oxoadipate enol-lactonase